MSQTLPLPNLRTSHASILKQKDQSHSRQDTSIKIFCLQKQQSSQSESFRFTFTNGWFQNKFSINLYTLFERTDLNEHFSLRILDPKKCQFKQIEKISFNVAQKSLFIRDSQFWDIIAQDFETVRIEYANYQNSLLLNTSGTWKSNLIDKKTDQNGTFVQEHAASSSDQSDHKGKRSGQRTIQQVILLVQKWRKFEGNNSQSMKKEKKVSLMEAANEVGVSKKSLDDYYYQLRTGEKLNFDFMSHLDDKIGVLRNFIKRKFPKRKVGEKNGKHGKKLNIIENFTPQESSSIQTLFEDSKMDKIEQRVTSTEQDLILDAKISLSLDDLFYGLEDNDLQDCIHVDAADQIIECLYEPMF